MTTVIVAFFDTEGQCPDPNFIDPNDGNRYPVPLSGHCPAHVQSVLGGYVNERRLEDGLQGLQLTAELSADAQTFTDCHHRGLDCWAVPRFANFGLAFYEHTFANSDVATTHLDLDKDLLGPWMARPDRVLRVDRSIPLTPEEWARVRVMGFGCGSWIGPRESDLIDQRATLFVVAFFSSGGGGGEDVTTTTTSTTTTTTTTPAPTTAEPDPEPYPDDDPEYVIPQESRQCPDGLAERALLTFNSMRLFKGLPPLQLDPSGLTSALAQDFTNHHMSWASFYNASFAGHGFDGDRLMYLPAPPDNRPLRVHLKYTLQLVAAEAVVLRPSRLGVLGEHFDPEEWAQTKVMGLGCTSWPSEWLQGKEDGGGGGAGIAQRVVVQTRALDAVSGQAIGNGSSTGSSSGSGGGLPQEGGWKIGVNFVLVAFFKSPWAVPNVTTTTTTSTTTTTPTTTTTTTTPTTTTTTTTPKTTTTTTTPTTTTTTTTTTTITTTPTTTTTSTTTPSTTTTTSTTPRPGGFPFIVTNGTQKCKTPFTDSLIGHWNVYRMQKNMKELIMNQDAQDFGQKAANNVSVDENIFIPSFNFGILNYTLIIQEQKEKIYVYPEDIVRENQEKLPLTKLGKHFNYDEFSRTHYFGVGCSTFIDSKKQSKLFIAMIFKRSTI